MNYNRKNPSAPTQFETRRMESTEARRVSLLVRAVVSPLEYYSEKARQTEIAKYTPARLRSAIEEDPDSVLVAISSGTVIGFCISRIDDGLIWLAWFGVNPTWRGKGVGMGLLKSLERTVHLRGCHKIWCDCRTSNAQSQSVLSTFGFKKICKVTRHWYGHDYFLWEKHTS